MEKIYYNSQGFVCERYPLDIPIDDENRFIEVENEVYNQTLQSKPHFCWKVFNGELIEERYENEAQEEIDIEELSNLKEWFIWYDTQVIQYNRDLRLFGKSDINLNELDKLAVQKASRIKTIEKESDVKL